MANFEKIGGIFTIIDDASPKLQKINSELDNSQSKLDKTAAKMLTFNARSLVAVGGITKLTFEFAQWLKEGTKMAEELDNLNPKLQKAKDNLNDFRDAMRDAQLQTGSFILQLKGLVSEALLEFIGKTEQARIAEDAMTNSMNLQKTMAASLAASQQDLINRAQNRLEILNALNEQDAEDIKLKQQQQAELQKLIELADEDKIRSAEEIAAIEKLKQLHEEERQAIQRKREEREREIKAKEKELEVIKRITDATGRQFFESGRGERVQVRSDFVQDPSTGKYVLAKKQGP